MPDVRERLAFETIQPVGSTSAELADLLPREIAKWGAIVKESGATVD
jgi:tripartite-type tricarboxylate transporter receptor subunit TctC